MRELLDEAAKIWLNIFCLEIRWWQRWSGRAGIDILN
jgi:hypothetical protein